MTLLSTKVHIPLPAKERLKMQRILFYTATLFLTVHGLIHLMGFAAYWPLAEIQELPYKTTLLGGRWHVGAGGMRIFSLLWLLAAVGFVAAAIALVMHQGWWLPALVGVTLLSLALCALDWSVAFRGALIDIVILIALLPTVGLRIPPKPFPPYPEQTPPLTTIPLPSNLPAPVSRYYEATLGEDIPLINSAVISGRATMRVFGITFPARFRFTHQAGQNYRHYIEATLFGIPIMKVNESYLDGNARMETPGGVIENEAKIDQAANLGLWAESIWLPSIFLIDPRVRWEDIDDNTAYLVVPFDSAQGNAFGDGEEVFTVVFDPKTELLSTLEAMRYREAADEDKILWHNEAVEWSQMGGYQLPTVGSATWMDEGTPWAVFTVEDVVYNVDVTDYIHASGP